MSTKNEELFAKTGEGSLPNEVFDKDSGEYSHTVQGFSKQSGNIGSSPQPSPVTPFRNLKKC